MNFHFNETKPIPHTPQSRHEIILTVSAVCNTFSRLGSYDKQDCHSLRFHFRSIKYMKYLHYTKFAEH